MLMISVSAAHAAKRSISSIMIDAETGKEQYIDTSSKALRNAHANYWRERMATLKHSFAKSSVDFVSVATNEDFVKALRLMFAMRA